MNPGAVGLVVASHVEPTRSVAHLQPIFSAVALPAVAQKEVVEALGLKEGDNIEIHAAGQRTFANTPELAKAFRFSSALSQGVTLKRRLLELVRLRIAFHNQCRS
jgi:hypothetical protein